MEMDWQLLTDSLSAGASLVRAGDKEFLQLARTWSELNHKLPAAIVRIATQEDVVTSVKFGICHNLPFRVRGGGHSLFSSIESPGFVIDMRLLNQIILNQEEPDTVTVQAGVINNELLEALTAAKSCTPTASATKVGVIGSLLGGGHTADSGIRGLMCDNLLAARIVTGDTGELVIASEDFNSDLFWGLRGAGWNFGIVTEVVLKTYRFEDTSLGSRTDGKVWEGSFIYTPDKIEEVQQYVWKNRRDDACFSYLFASAPPDFLDKPSIILALYFYGSDDDLVSITQSLKELGPIYSETVLLPYERANDGVDPWCDEEGRKVFFGAGLHVLQAETLTAIYNSYLELWETSSDFKKSVFMIDMPGKKAVEGIDSNAMAYAHRSINVWANAVPWYTDTSNDTVALKWGERVREILATVPEPTDIVYYINNSTGEEDPAILYGGEKRLQRLRKLKEKWDPRMCYGFQDFKSHCKL